GDGLAIQGHGLHAAGDAARAGGVAAAVRGIAPFHSGAGAAVRWALDPDRRGPPSAHRWEDEIQPVAERACPAGPDHGNFPARLRDAADARLRSGGTCLDGGGAAEPADDGMDEGPLGHLHDGQPAAAPERATGAGGSAVHLAGADRRAADADLPREPGQEPLPGADDAEPGAALAAQGRLGLSRYKD